MRRSSGKKILALLEEECGRTMVDFPVLLFQTSCTAMDFANCLNKIYSLDFRRYEQDIPFSVPKHLRMAEYDIKCPLFYDNNRTNGIFLKLIEIPMWVRQSDRLLNEFDKMLFLDGSLVRRLENTLYTDLSTTQPMPVAPGDFLGKHCEDMRYAFVRNAIITVHRFDINNRTLFTESDMSFFSMNARPVDRNTQFDFLHEFFLNFLNSVDSYFDEEISNGDCYI